MKIRNMLGLLTAAVLMTSTSAALAGGDAAAGAKIFKKKCHVCHTVEAGGSNKIGPNLHTVAGRAAGTWEGFRYSKAMKESGITWTDENLDHFLTKPRDFVKKTKMTFPGLKKEDDREDVIAFLKSQK